MSDTEQIKYQCEKCKKEMPWEDVAELICASDECDPFDVARVVCVQCKGKE